MNRIEPSHRKLLGVFVRIALANQGDDTIDATKRNPKAVDALRRLGFIHPTENSLTKEAFLAYFDQFDAIDCPDEVHHWVQRLHVTDIRWRRAAGIIKSLMPQQRGKAFPLLTTVFIGDNAALGTWFHELGHIVFPRVRRDDIASLAQAATKVYSVVSHEDVLDAADPNTLRPTALPEGRYLNINGQYCGLDHSGESEDAVNDEIWAILFTEYCHGVRLPRILQDAVENIVTSLERADIAPHADVRSIDVG